MDLATITVLTVIFGGVFLVLPIFWRWLGQRAEAALSFLLKTPLTHPVESERVLNGLWDRLASDKKFYMSMVLDNFHV